MTKIASWARVVAAMSMSFGPMGVPMRCKVSREKRVVAHAIVVLRRPSEGEHVPTRLSGFENVAEIGAG